MLMTIEFGSPRSFGVVAVPHGYVLQSDCCVQLPHALFIPFRRNDVVSGDMRVAGVNASGNRNHAAQAIQEFRHLLEGAAQRIFRAGGVLDRDLESTLWKI